MTATVMFRQLTSTCRIERSVDQERYDYCIRKLTETGAIITWVEVWVGEAVWELADKVEALQEVARLADNWCHMRLCPCCGQEWQCLDDCTYRTDDPGGYAQLEVDRRRINLIRKAVDRVRILGSLEPRSEPRQRDLKRQDDQSKVPGRREGLAKTM